MLSLPGWLASWNVSLSRLQTAVGLTAGLLSIAGALYPVTRALTSPPTVGDVVAVVQDARSHRPLAEATIEILTPGNALVTTLVSPEQGRVAHAMREGRYRVRVSHPRFVAETRQIQVIGGQTAEIRVALTPRAPAAAAPPSFLRRLF